MRDQAGRYLTSVVILFVLLTVVGSSVVLSTTPGPVIPLQANGSGIPAPAEPQPPAEAETQELGCHVGGPRPLPAVALGTTGLPLLVAGYPGPVIPVEAKPATPAEPPCRTELSLSLEVKSPKNADPEGADASIDDRLVPRRSLEAGFQTELPAQDREIRFSHPGEEWELRSVACSCSGETAGVSALGFSDLAGPAPIGQLTAYPAPVYRVPSSAKGGSARCGSGTGSPATASSATAGITSGVRATASGATRKLTTASAYPGPVVPAEWVKRKPAPAPTREAGLVSWDARGNVKIVDRGKAGGIVDCKWTVEHVYGRVTVRTVTKPTGAEPTISYNLRPIAAASDVWPRGVTGSATGTQQLLHNGEWSLEPSTVKDGWEFVESKCQESDTEKRTTAQGATAQLGVDVGDDITCTYRWKLITPREGPWKAVHKPGTATCSAKGGGTVTIRFDGESGPGRIVHQNEGDRLVMTGKGSGLIPVTVDRDPDDPRRYRGTTTRSFSGAKARFTFAYKVVSEKKMNGSLTATWKQGGNKCVFKRKITLTHAN